MHRASKPRAARQQRAFGSDEVYLEKAITDPRHIEIQVLADEHGNCVYLGERECSIQRRHQKVSKNLLFAVSPEMRQRMGETAVRAAQAAAYANAGTIEFLADARSNFYFLEMNTRLQVEHPITEVVTGLDLLHLQIRIAARREAALQSRKIFNFAGTASNAAFTPKIPTIISFPAPVWISSLVSSSARVSASTAEFTRDGMSALTTIRSLSKLIAYGANRDQAIARIRRAIDEYVITGVKTNLSLFRRVLDDPDFLAGQTIC